MSKEFSIYHKDIGVVHIVGGDPKEVMKSYPEGTITIPLRPSDLHEWKDGAWREVEGYDEQLGNSHRAKRHYYLSTVVDPIVSNPLRWGSMPENKKNALIEYRKQLLDIPKQKGFPRKVIWPVAPNIG